MPKSHQQEHTDIEPATMEDFERYQTLRDTMLSMEEEKSSLAVRIRAGLNAGLSYTSDIYRAELKPSSSVEYPMDRFREAFGDAAALEVSTIDRKRADELAKAGELDAQTLSNIAVRKERTPSVILQPLS